MKRFAAVTLAALMLLAVFASAASAADSVEIRGPVYNGSNIDTIIDTFGNGNDLTVDATQFAAFYYDIDDNVTTETLSISDVTGTENNIIGEGGIRYKTQIKQVAYKYDRPAAGWSNYSIIGLFADKYIPLKPAKADKLAKLVLDSNDKYTIRTGEKLDLGQGYSVQAKQVDVDGKKVWLELDKDGTFVDDEIIEVGTGDATSNTWNVELDDILGEDDVVVMRLHVNQVFQGAVDSIAQIEGIWLIDYANAREIKSDDEFGELNSVSISGDTLEISNEDTFTLTRDSTNEIAEGMAFKVADTGTDVLRFYPMKEITAPGTYEIRGQVASGTGDVSWNAANFAGFYYDIKDDVSTESLNVAGITSGNVIPAGGLRYNTQIKNVAYEYDRPAAGWNTYPVIGFFAERYIPLKAAKADKLAKLVLDSNDKYTIRTGEKLDLGQGYAVSAKQVDVDGKKVWLELTKDGTFVDDEIIEVGSGDATSNTWNVELDDILGEDDVRVMRLHVNQVFQGAVDSIAQIEGIWLIDYANAMEIKSDDEFDNLNKVSISGDTLAITNDDDFTLTRDSDELIARNMSFKIADTGSNDLRYYPFVEVTLGNETTGVPGQNVTAPGVNVTAPGNVTGNVTPPANVTPGAPAPGVTPVEGQTVAPGTTPANTTKPEGGIPGFESVWLGIAGLLAVFYLVRKNN